MVLRNRVRYVALWVAVLGSFGTAIGLWFVVVQLPEAQLHSNVPEDTVLASDEGRSSLPLTSKSANAVPSSAPLADRLTPDLVVSAFNCARRQRMLPSYVRRPDLDTTAARLLENAAPLQSGEAGFTLTGQLILDTTQPVRECHIGGFNVAQVHDLERATEIGVAVAPLPQPGLFVAVVVGQ